MENPIRKPKKFIPNLFKMFTLYIFVMLGAFFGYVQIFGGIAPTSISLPINGVSAQEDDDFGSFVSNIMSVRSLQADGFSLSYTSPNGDTNIALNGSLAFVYETMNVSVDINLVYNDDVFNVAAVYTSPDLYLRLDDTTYKFKVNPADFAGSDKQSFDVGKVLGLIKDAVPFDMSVLTNKLAEFGINVDDLGALTEKLSISTKQLDDGSYKFGIGLSNIVSVDLLCDKEYNLVSAKMAPIRVKGHTLRFDASNILMNKEEIAQSIVAPECEYVDMTEVTSYVDYIRNLAYNNFYKIDANLTVGEKSYDAVISIDKSNGFKAKARTNVEGVDVCVVYLDNVVYLDLDNVKLSFKVDDYRKWYNEIERFVENRMSTTIADIVKDLVKRVIAERGLEDINVKETALSILSKFSGTTEIKKMLPNEVVDNGNSFEMRWENGLYFVLRQEQNVFSGASARFNDFGFDVSISSDCEEIDVSGEYYDVSSVLPIFNFVDEVLTSKQVSGLAHLTYQGLELDANYVVDFSNGLLAKIEIENELKDVSVYIKDNRAFVCVDTLVIEANLDEKDDYIEKVEALAGIELPKINLEIEINKDKVVGLLLDILNNLHLSTDGTATIVEYKGHSVRLDFDGRKVLVGYDWNDINVTADVEASAEEIVLPTATDNLADVLEKAKNVKEYVEGKRYAFDYAVSYEEINVSGTAKLDLENEVYEAKVNAFGKEIKVRYENGVAYVEYKGSKIRVSIDSVKELVEIIKPILASNDVSVDMPEVDTDGYIEKLFGEDVLSLTITELVNKLTIDLTGTLNDLTLNVETSTTKPQSAQVEVKFEENKLKSVNVETNGITANVEIIPFALAQLDEQEYYNILSTQEGTVKVNYKGQEIDVDLKLDLDGKIYVNAKTELLGEQIELTILNNKLYIQVGELTLGTDFNGMKELVEKIVETFELTLPTFEIDTDALKDFDFSAVEDFAVEGLEFAISGTELNVRYANADLSVELELASGANYAIEVPAEYEELESLVNKAKNLMDYIQKQIFEFEFEVEYKDLVLDGTVKFENEVLEIQMTINGEVLYLRMQNQVVYMSYGNLKLKFAIPEEMPEMDMMQMLGMVKDKLAELEIVDLTSLQNEIEEYSNYTLERLLDEIQIRVLGDTNALRLVATLGEREIEVVANFENDKFVGANVKLLNEVNLALTKASEEATIEEFVEEDYVDFFDTARFAPVVNILKEIVEAKKVAGNISATIEGVDVDVEYAVNFDGDVVAEVRGEALGEGVSIFYKDEKVSLQIGEIVVAVNLTEYEDIVARIDQIFGTELASKLPDLKDTNIDLKDLAKKALGILSEISVAEEQGLIANVRYLEHIVKLSEADGLKVDYTNGEYSVVLTAKVTDKNIVVPVATDELDDIFEKIENVKEYVEGKRYAFDYAVSYEEINVSGTAKLDLENEVYEAKVNAFGKEIKVRYENGVAYVEYKGSKIRVSIDSVKELVEIIKPILASNDVSVDMPEVDTDGYIEKLFGEDVLSLTITELVNKLTIDLTGTLNDLTLNVETSTTKPQSAQVEVKFEENKLKSVNVETNGITANVEIIPFALAQLDEQEYYNILSTQEGTVKVNYKGQEIDVDLKLDLDGKIYVNAKTELLGEQIELTILNNKLYIQVGELTLGTDFNGMKELVEKIVETFELTLPTFEIDTDALKDFDFSAVEDFAVEGLEFAISGTELNVRYANADLSVELELASGANYAIEVPAEYEELESLVNKAKNLMDYIQKQIFEFEFKASYNEFEFEGTLKYNGTALEIRSAAMGENVYFRYENDMLYFAYGNMKLKFDVSNTKVADVDFNDILEKLLGDELPVRLQFGVFEELLRVLKDYKLEDYLENILVDVDGDTNNAKVVIEKKTQNILNSTILTALVKFDANTDKLEKLSVNVYDILKAEFVVDNVEQSTIEEFDEANFADYSDDFVAGMLDSLKVRENVYASSSDILIRYSNNTFDGRITLMLDYDENVETILGHFIPSLQIYTTSLGFESYINIINETAYIDIQGLQISADLKETTINEVLDFVEDEFGKEISLDSLAQTTNAFKVIIPAVDKIYGSWIKLLQNAVEYNGVQIKIDDALWYGESSRFEDITLQAFIEVENNTVMPKEIAFGANIYDPNTIVYDSYDEYLMDVERPFTYNNNFAVYLTNFKVGPFLTDLAETFVENQNGDVVALKSNYGTTVLSDYVSYKQVLKMAKAVLALMDDTRYQVSLNGSLLDGENKKTKLEGNVNVEFGDLPQGAANTSGFELFDGKYLKVLGALGLTTNADTSDSMRHLAEVFYESNGSSALYTTYTHGSFIGSGSTIKAQIANASNKLKAKVNNANLSDIVSMICKFVGLDLGDEMKDKLGLTDCTTDFRYLRKLIGLKDKAETNTTISQGDKIISSLEDVAAMIKNIKLSQKDLGNGLNELTLTLSVDLFKDGNVATVSIVFKDERSANTVSTKLRKIVVSNLVFGENTINATINVEDFNAANFDYNTSASHINFSDLSTFMDAAVTTLNTKNWAFKGGTEVSIGGGLYTVNVSYDVYVSLDENDELYMYIELDVPFKASVTGQALPNPDYTVYIVGGSYDKRTSILEYKNGYLTIVQKTYGIKTTLFSSKSDQIRGYGHGDNWRYSKDQIGDNIMKIMAQALGLSETAYDIIKTAINSIEAHPTVEESLLGFSSSNSGYQLKVNAENLTGMNGVENMTLNIGVSKPYNVKIDGVDQGQHRFIDSISTELKIGSLLSVPLTLQSVSGDSYRTYDGKTIYTNDYYRRVYAQQIKTLRFETNCSQYFDPIVNPAAEPINIPTPTNYTTNDGTAYRAYNFAGWYTTSNFAEGTKYETNLMPNDDTTLYAKWDVDTRYYRTVTFNTNADRYSVDSIRDLEGTAFNLQTLAGFVVDDGVTVKTYSFAGWFTTANFAEGTQMATGIIPSVDTTLYAKWNVDVKYYRTVSFETNSIYSTASIYDVEGREFTLPTYETYDADDGVTYEVYTFVGWFTTANFAEGTQLSAGIIPSVDTTIYAKWDAYVQYYRTVSYETNSPEEIAGTKQLVGTTFTLPTPRQKQETEGYLTTFYLFDGWFTTSDFAEGTQMTSGIIPSADTTLYAKWNVERIVRSYQINLYDEGELVDSTRAVAGEEFDLSDLNRVHDNSLFYTDDLFSEMLESFIMPERDLNLYLRNEYTLRYYHYVLENNTYVGKEDAVLLYQRDVIDFLPTQTNTYIDYRDASNVLSYRVYFEFSAYSNVEDSITMMPNYDYSITSTMTTRRVDYHTVTLYDNGAVVDSFVVLAGDTITFAGHNKINSTTKLYTNSNYSTLLSSYVMPDNNLAVHVRNQYTLTYSYYNKENNDYVKKTATKTLYQGEAITLPTQTNDYIDYRNSSNELSYRKYFNFGAYSNVADGITVMTNYDYTISNTMTTSTKNYYKVVYDVRTYRVLGMALGWAWKTSASFTPATEYHFAGDTINLNQDKYKPTATGWKTAIHTNTVLVTYQITTWGKSAWGSLTSGGSGFTSYTVEASDASDGYTITLYGCWKQK